MKYSEKLYVAVYTINMSFKTIKTTTQTWHPFDN